MIKDSCNNSRKVIDDKSMAEEDQVEMKYPIIIRKKNPIVVISKDLLIENIVNDLVKRNIVKDQCSLRRTIKNSKNSSG